MKTGIFGGAFNPIHKGHVHLAVQYKESLGLDRIIFIPTANPPHKSAAELAAQQDRISMIRLALQGREGFEVSDLEFHRQGKSYTYDTVTQLKRLYPQDDFYLIMGADQFLNFHSWYQAEKLAQMVTLCTAAREDGQEKRRLVEYSNSLPFLNNCYLSDFPVMKMSSNEIRERIKNHQDLSDYLDKKVEKYIMEKGLYGVSYREIY